MKPRIEEPLLFWCLTFWSNRYVEKIALPVGMHSSDVWQSVRQHMAYQRNLEVEARKIAPCCENL